MTTRSATATHYPLLPELEREASERFYELFGQEWRPEYGVLFWEDYEREQRVRVALSELGRALNGAAAAAGVNRAEGSTARLLELRNAVQRSQGKTPEIRKAQGKQSALEATTTILAVLPPHYFEYLVEGAPRGNQGPLAYLLERWARPLWFLLVESEAAGLKNTRRGRRGQPDRQRWIDLAPDGPNLKKLQLLCVLLGISNKPFGKARLEAVLGDPKRLGSIEKNWDRARESRRQPKEERARARKPKR